jgi:hypothetical protein
MIEPLSSPMYGFCTYFDHLYLPQGLSLYRSLSNHCPTFHLWILCMDTACFEILSGLNLPHATPIPLESLETYDPELLIAKGNRNSIEYYFTCTPSLPLYILARHPEVKLITYLDADLFFFAEPRPIFDEIGRSSIAIIGHRFPDTLRHLEECGKYNVGWLSFRRDDWAKACLQWWRERCLEWCYDRVENGRFADQKYLDDWPHRFGRVVVLKHKGANLAPWNLANYTLRKWRNQLFVDGDPLIFYHFHALKRIYPWLYDPQLDFFGVRSSSLLVRGVYQPYLRTMVEATRFLGGLRGNKLLANRGPARTPTGPDAFTGPRVVKYLKWICRICRGVLTRKTLCLVGGHVL